jgi:hypothetical protein
MCRRARQSKCRLAVPSVLAIAVLLPAGSAGQAPQLDWGPHAVGFRVIEALDSTRAFRPLRDHRGTAAEETARPIQLSVWYPALPDPDGPRMTGGDFRVLRETTLEPGRTPAATDRDRLRAEFIRTAIGAGADSAAAATAWNATTPAVRDAPPVAGAHPAVLYFTAAGVSNPLLPAYLASHGFAVASFSSNGRMTRSSLEFTPNALTLDTLAGKGRNGPRVRLHPLLAQDSQHRRVVCRYQNSGDRGMGHSRACAAPARR